MNSDIELKNHIICEFLIRKTAPSILVEASKIAYDIYATTDNSKWLDWGVMGENSIDVKQ